MKKLTSLRNDMMQQLSLLLILFFSVLFHCNIHAINSISIIANEQLLQNPTTQKTIDDCIRLLQKACQCKVNANDRDSEIQLLLPDQKITIDTQKNILKDSVSYLAYPAQDYHWTSKRIGKQIILTLDATSFEAISFGLYGLLQEQLGFAFYHTKQTYIPNISYWGITENLDWSVRPRFIKRGFHLHTMHPLEITEPLLNQHCENGIELVIEYIDWLARNQQNYLEFNLLEKKDKKDLKEWINYIKPAMLYAQRRGILIGVDISLHMTQQKAFMLYESLPNNFQKKQKQIEENLAILFEVPWDVIAMEFSTTEFTQGNVQKKQDLQLYINDLVSNTYHAKLTGREHVVKKENTLGKSQQVQPMTAAQKKLDQTRGVLIHTVMFYGLNDQKAPVYENENLLHMLDMLQEEQKHREIWYYPESAYWVTFDNSVPMLLLPYLNTRLADILLMDSLNVEGHLTFSSGWEWGYWLIDWSIARWSWESSFEGRIQQPNPLEYINTLLQNGKASKLLSQVSELQQTYIKEKEMIRYLVAQTITDELPFGLAIEFHPSPPHSYRYMARKAPQDTIDWWKNNVIPTLQEFTTKYDLILAEMNQDFQFNQQQALLFNEIKIALQVTNLRVKHKIETIQFLLKKRQQKLDKNLPDSLAQIHLDQAKAIRLQGIELVALQEQHYRYPMNWVAEKINGGGSTSYDFGYLYTVHNLHFWQREEQQIEQNKFGPFFNSIWDVSRILGVVD